MSLCCADAFAIAGPSREQQLSSSAGSSHVDQLLTGRTKDAHRLFITYDVDRDGLLSQAEVYAGLESWGLDLQADMFQQFVDCNFMYADRDTDGMLNTAEWTQLFKLMSEVGHMRNMAECHRHMLPAIRNVGSVSAILLATCHANAADLQS